MITEDLVRLILQAHTFEDLKKALEIATREAAEEAEAADREWNVDSLGQD